MLSLPTSSASLLVRTDFSHDEAWMSLTRALATESEDGFVAYFDIVDDRRFERAAWSALRSAVPANDNGASVLCIADAPALDSPDGPVLIVNLNDYDVEPFRCIASELWGVENNLNISNMDWEEFAESTVDGVFRGF